MEYAVMLFLPVLAGLLLGSWLTKNYGIDPLWTVVLAVLGMVMGIAILYRQHRHTVGKTSSATGLKKPTERPYWTPHSDVKDGEAPYDIHDLHELPEESELPDLPVEDGDDKAGNGNRKDDSTYGL